MATNISPENERFIQQEIAHGRFQDRGDALDAGIGLLRQQRALIERLASGRRQLNAGEYLEFNADGLRGLFNELKDRAQ